MVWCIVVVSVIVVVRGIAALRCVIAVRCTAVLLFVVVVRCTVVVRGVVVMRCMTAVMWIAMVECNVVVWCTVGVGELLWCGLQFCRCGCVPFVVSTADLSVHVQREVHGGGTIGDEEKASGSRDGGRSGMG